jgi:hypothetical protein
MGGNTGNIRTLRNQSGTVGFRTLGSILASDTSAGAGSVRRIYSYYYNKTGGNPNPIGTIFSIYYGQFRSRSQYFISSIYG